MLVTAGRLGIHNGAMANPPVTQLTEEQRLELERAAFKKSEYHDGQMFAMACG